MLTYADVWLSSPRQAARDSTDAYKTQVAAEREAELVRAAEREAAWEGSREERERERISEQVLTLLALLVQKYKYISEQVLTLLALLVQKYK